MCHVMACRTACLIHHLQSIRYALCDTLHNLSHCEVQDDLKQKCLIKTGVSFLIFTQYQVHTSTIQIHVLYSCRLVCGYFCNLYNVQYHHTKMSFCIGGDVGGRERMVPTTCVCNLLAVLLKRYICFLIFELVPPFQQ